MLLGIGEVPGLLAVCIYTFRSLRLTNLGIRLVDKQVLEQRMLLVQVTGSASRM